MLKKCPSLLFGALLAPQTGLTGGSCKLIFGFSGPVGDHLKFATLSEDLPEHKIVNYVYEVSADELKDDLHLISSREYLTFRVISLPRFFPISSNCCYRLATISFNSSNFLLFTRILRLSLVGVLATDILRDVC